MQGGKFRSVFLNLPKCVRAGKFVCLLVPLGTIVALSPISFPASPRVEAHDVRLELYEGTAGGEAEGRIRALFLYVQGGSSPWPPR